MKIIKTNNELFEMAMPRKIAFEKIEKYNKEITSHIMKCIVYPYSRDLDHWVKEIANLFTIINRVVLKQSSPKFEYQEYRDSVFGYFGDEKYDCANELDDFHYEYVMLKHYPDFEITNDLVNKLYEFVSNLSDEVIKIFITKNNKNMDDFETIIRKNLSLINY